MGADWGSATECWVPLMPVLRPLFGAGSASGAGVTVTCTPSCSCVPGSADDLGFLIRGQAIHLTTSAYRFQHGGGPRSVFDCPPLQGCLKRTSGLIDAGNRRR